MQIFNFTRLFSFLLLTFFCVDISSQNTPGARPTSMGGCAVVNEDVWGTFHNQASLVHIEAISAAVFYENRFMLKELSDRGATLAVPLKNSAFGLSYRSFGYNAFNHAKAGLSYALKLSSKFSFGIQFNYHTLRLGENYGTTTKISFEGGFLYRYNTKLSLAAHVLNPTRTQIADFNNERLPTLLRLGAGYKFSDKVVLNAEVKKPSDAAASIHGGLEYWVANEVAIRVGFNSLNTFSFGFGWKLKMLQIDAAAGFNSVLGFTPQISITYSGKKS